MLNKRLAADTHGRVGTEKVCLSSDWCVHLRVNPESPLMSLCCDDRPFIVLTETKFSLRCIPVWIGTLLTGLGSKKNTCVKKPNESKSAKDTLCR